MRKDDRQMPTRPQPEQLPMPRYDYQKAEGGSISSPYRGEQRPHEVPQNVLQAIHFA